MRVCKLVVLSSHIWIYMFRQAEARTSSQVVDTRCRKDVKVSDHLRALNCGHGDDDYIQMRETERKEK